MKWNCQKSQVFSSSSRESSPPDPQRAQWCVNLGTHNSATLLNENRMLVKAQILQAMRKQNPKSPQRSKSDMIFYTEEEVTDPGWKSSHHILILFIWGKMRRASQTQGEAVVSL